MGGGEGGRTSERPGNWSNDLRANEKPKKSRFNNASSGDYSVKTRWTAVAGLPIQKFMSGKTAINFENIDFKMS